MLGKDVYKTIAYPSSGKDSTPSKQSAEYTKKINIYMTCYPNPYTPEFRGLVISLVHSKRALLLLT